jgi:hypothetical protein
MLTIKDYAITLRDSNGKECELFINADSIYDLLRHGDWTLDQAIESVEQRAGDNAIASGEIDADCWVEKVTVG